MCPMDGEPPSEHNIRDIKTKEKFMASNFPSFIAKKCIQFLFHIYVEYATWDINKCKFKSSFPVL